ncbi:MAG: hypothetical protein NTW33_01885 [Methanoregula sp.]|nr:hypothetical protein [Methanoregula sp.]
MIAVNWKKEESIVEKCDNFIKTRCYKGAGKKYVKEIVKFLKANRDTQHRDKQEKENGPDGCGWVRPNEFQKKYGEICCYSTLSRLLTALTSEGIVERQGRERKDRFDRSGQEPVYYRISPHFEDKVPTQYGKFSNLYYKNIELSNNLELAKSILDEHNLIDEYTEYIAKRQKRSEERKHLTKDEKNKIITHNTPAEIKKRRWVWVGKIRRRCKREICKKSLFVFISGRFKKQ